MQNRVQKKKKISLTTMIFIALLAGALTGVIINYLIPSNYMVDDIIVQGVFYIVGQDEFKSLFEHNDEENGENE